MQSLTQPLDEIKPNFGVRVTHMNGACNSKKGFGQISLNINNKQDFCSDAWVMPQGWDYIVAMGCPGGVKFFFEHTHVAYQLTGMMSRTECK